MNATRPIGTLTKKIQRQLALSRINPPSAGPKIGASMAGTATTLITRPMRRGPAAWAIIIWPIGNVSPPPMPWSTRKKISSVDDVARPHSAEPRVNSTSEVRYTGLAPKRRATQPEIGITAASDSRYPVTTHWMLAIEV